MPRGRFSNKKPQSLAKSTVNTLMGSLKGVKKSRGREEIGDKTIIGIEIEMCINSDFYESLQGKLPGIQELSPKEEKKIKETYVFPEGKEVDFEGIKVINDVEEETILNKIILTTDPSCECESGFENAEINSPALHKYELKKFYNKFLKKILFNDMDNIYQGNTCGVHIHWSNSKLQEKTPEENPDYILEFMKIIENFRMLNVEKIIKPEFSGRKQIYIQNEENTNIIRVPSNIYEDKKDAKIFRIKDFTIDLKSKEKFKDIKNRYLDNEVKFYEFKVKKPKSYLAQKMFCKKEKLVENNSNLIKSEIESLINKYFENLREKRVKEYLESIDDPLKKELEEKAKTILEKYIRENYKYKEIKGKRRGRSKTGIPQANKEYYEVEESGETKFNLLKFLTEFETKYVAIDFSNNQVFYYNFDKISNLIDMLKLEGIEDNKYINELLSSCDDTILNIIFQEVGSSKKYSEFYKEINGVEIEDKKIINDIYTNYNSRSDINLYDVKDFHVEFRLFSLDTLFEGKKPTATDIVNRLDYFVQRTDTFMTNVLTKLNRFYDFTNDEVKKSLSSEYEEYFLFNETNSMNQKVKNKLFELFGIQKKTINGKPRLIISRGGPSLTTLAEEEVEEEEVEEEDV